MKWCVWKYDGKHKHWHVQFFKTRADAKAQARALRAAGFTCMTREVRLNQIMNTGRDAF